MFNHVLSRKPEGLEESIEAPFRLERQNLISDDQAIRSYAPITPKLEVGYVLAVLPNIEYFVDYVTESVKLLDNRAPPFVLALRRAQKQITTKLGACQSLF